MRIFLRGPDFTRLFGYEVYGGRDALLWHDPYKPSRDLGREIARTSPSSFKTNPNLSTSLEMAVTSDPHYNQWKEQKREFTQEEILGCYIKIRDNGETFIMWLHEDGSLTEKPLFNQDDEWSGSWKLTGGVVKTKIGSYSLHIVANREGNLHSAIGYTRETEPDYFKVIHLT